MGVTILTAYDIIREYVSACYGELCALSRFIYEHPERCFEERESSAALQALLEKHGFAVTAGYCGLETAFLAEKRGLPGGPVVCIMAEYDALPMGHACGHNLIAAISAGAAIALGGMLEGLPGAVRVIGTPAEEGGGGKVYLCARGGFEGSDFALQVHPGRQNLVQRGGLAVRSVEIEFFGRMAHSSRPEQGINALTAVLQTFSMLDAQRALLPIKANVNGIITDGGRANNVIPEHAACSFCARANDVRDLQRVTDAIERAAQAAAALTGARAEVRKGILYAERYPNREMDERYKAHLEAMGEAVEYPKPQMKFGSSDVGNVSLMIPTIQPYIRICDEDCHTEGFLEAARSERAQEQMAKAAAALAMTGYDLLTDEALRRRVREEFARTAPAYARSELGYEELK